MYHCRLKEAVKEYTAALELDPNSSKALRHRAKALERSGQYKAALADVMAVNRTDSATDETREAERRLRDLAAGRRPSLANGGGARAVGPAGRGAPARGGAPAWPFSAKLTLGAETRAAPLSAAAGYADLLTAFQAKFPDAGACVYVWGCRIGSGMGRLCVCKGGVREVAGGRGYGGGQGRTTEDGTYARGRVSTDHPALEMMERLHMDAAPACLM